MRKLGLATLAGAALFALAMTHPPPAAAACTSAGNAGAPTIAASAEGIKAATVLKKETADRGQMVSQAIPTQVAMMASPSALATETIVTAGIRKPLPQAMVLTSITTPAVGDPKVMGPTAVYIPTSGFVAA